MDFALGAFVAVTGWIVSHRLSLRAQTRNFQNQLLDRARMEISKSLRSYQDWLGSIGSALVSVSTNAALEQGGLRVDWEATRLVVRELLATHRVGAEWIINLEEYEALFPETRSVRFALVEREHQVLNILSQLSTDLMGATFPGAPVERRAALASWAHGQQGFILDQDALISDLRVHLQNVSLSRITGTKAALRKPTDPTLPIIAIDSHGQLIIVQASQARVEAVTLTRD